MLRLAYACLILWQPVWHGWVIPERYWLGILLAVILLLPAWGIFRQQSRAEAIGGFLAIFYLVAALMLILSLRWSPMIQVGICLWYLGIIMRRGWLRRRAIKTEEME